MFVSNRVSFQILQKCSNNEQPSKFSIKIKFPEALMFTLLNNITPTIITNMQNSVQLHHDNGSELIKVINNYSMNIFSQGLLSSKVGTIFLGTAESINGVVHMPFLFCLRNRKSFLQLCSYQSITNQRHRMRLNG